MSGRGTHGSRSESQPQRSAYSYSRQSGECPSTSTDPRSQPQRSQHATQTVGAGKPPLSGVALQLRDHEIHFNQRNWKPATNPTHPNGYSAMYVGNNCGTVNFVGVDMNAHVDATAVEVGKNDRRDKPAWYNADLKKIRGGPAAIFAFNNVEQLTLDGAEPRVEIASGFVTRVQNSDGRAIPEDSEREKERRLSAIRKFDPTNVEASP